MSTAQMNPSDNSETDRLQAAAIMFTARRKEPTRTNHARTARPSARNIARAQSAACRGSDWISTGRR